MNDNIEETVVNNMQNDESERLIKFMREKNISDGVIMLVMLGIGSHTNYYNVLYNRLNNTKELLTDEVVKKEALDLFHEIDRNEEE